MCRSSCGDGDEVAPISERSRGSTIAAYPHDHHLDNKKDGTMPTITKLAPETTPTTRGPSERQHIATLYDALLAVFAAGDWGDVLLEAGDERAVVSRRLSSGRAARPHRTLSPAP
jgi:hypothetical protein